MTESEKIYRLLASIDRRLSRLERQAEADNAREVDTAAACRILGKSAGAVNKMVQRGQLNARKAENGRLRYKLTELNNYYKNN
jgi:ribosome-binding ATPase YchF (GTP1/OBG family)